ncbi:nuclear transport factor 2 family protein [Flaviramulus sp. BrNp1-15]|uniref:YybH family protein n=1 Tax=Flaviramulus sp. BrNp1-15 TaxID=2916754 RepID=UPI001EE7A4C5|nr:nuclear transport factor 2 family protein [Flaviramulus sp. BrNp1-15]ULC60171.1 nuclear transport factor 2 family protein [Flaviramulus sp. BrNp1-15]
MKTKLIVMLVVILGLSFTNCKEKEQTPIIEESKVDILNDDFPEAKAEIKKVIDDIFKCFQENDADKLIAHHIYGSKFTEFRNDEPRFGSEENEAYERGFVGAISNFDYTLGGLKIDVFGDVSVVTFEADFRPKIQEQTPQIWANVTLVFIKVNNTWKITHEHFSQFEKTKNV